MKYYCFETLTKSGEPYKFFLRAPDHITPQEYFDFVDTCFSNVSNFRQISKSTYYRHKG